MTWISIFFHGTLFLLERTTDKQTTMISQNCSFGGHFSKMNEVSLSFQGKQLKVFVANNKMWAFNKKWKLRKHIYHHKLDSFPLFKDFSDEICVMETDVNFFFMLKMKYVNIWKIYITQWNGIFQMTSTWCYKMSIVKYSFTGDY